MTIPMEILSLMTTRTEIGSPNRQRASSGFDTGFRQAFEDAHAQMEATLPVADGGKLSDVSVEDGAELCCENKPQDKDCDLALAVGVMVIQENVVFILEGDMESVTSPELSIDAVCSDKTDTDVIDALPTETNEAVQDKAVSSGTDEPDFDLYAAKTDEATQVHSNVKKTDTESVDSGANEAILEGDVAARKPIIRTSEQSETDNSKKDGLDYLRDGAPSHLENENDTVGIDGKKGKEFPETAEQKTTDETTGNSLPPLSEGIAPERFQAEQQLKQATATPVSKENLFDEMISRIEMTQTQTQQTMTIQLKPEFLGKVALEIAMDTAGLHLKINAADPGVRGMINAQINALIESLENKGIEVAEVEVAYSNVDNGSYQNPQGNKNAQQPKASGKSHAINKIENTDNTAATTSEMLDHYLDIGVSTVEYSA